MPRPNRRIAQRHRLRVTIGELRVGRFGEQHLPPTFGQTGERLASQRELLGNFIPQEVTQARHIAIASSSSVARR